MALLRGIVPLAALLLALATPARAQTDASSWHDAPVTIPGFAANIGRLQDVAALNGVVVIGVIGTAGNPSLFSRFLLGDADALPAHQDTESVSASNDYLRLEAGATSMVASASNAPMSLNPTTGVWTTDPAWTPGTLVLVAGGPGPGPTGLYLGTLGQGRVFTTAWADSTDLGALGPNFWSAAAGYGRGVLLDGVGQVWEASALAGAWTMLPGTVPAPAASTSARVEGDGIVMSNGIALLAYRATAGVNHVALVQPGTAPVDCVLPAGETFHRFAELNGDLLMIYGALQILSETGPPVFYRVPDPAATCATGLLAGATSFALPLDEAVGIAAWESGAGVENIVIAGQLANQPTLVFRNRPPSFPAGAMVDTTDPANLTLPAAVDPDGDPISYTWSCSNSVDGQSVAFTPNGAAANASVPTSFPNLCTGSGAFDCSVRVEDPESLLAEVAFQLPWSASDDDGAPVAGAANIDGAVYTEGATVRLENGTVPTLTVALTDKCLVDVTWTASDASLTLNDSQLGDFYSVTVPNLADDTSYTITATASDEAGGLTTFEFTIETFTPRVISYDLTCPTDPILVGDEAAIVTLHPAPADDVDVDFRCDDADGFTCTDGIPTEVTIDACRTEDITVAIRPFRVDLNREEPALPTCVIDVIADATLPRLVAASPLAVTVPLDRDGAVVDLTVDAALNTCDQAGTVVWDLSRLPPEAQGACGPSCTSAVVDGLETLSFAPSAKSVELVTDHAFPVIAHVIDEDGDTQPTDPIVFELTFVIDVPEVAVQAGVTVFLDDPTTRALEPGDVTRVHTRVVSDLAFSLPDLAVDLAGGGLELLPEPIEVTPSSCGASAEATFSSNGARLVAHGVDAECPLEVTWLARRGLGNGPLEVRACSFGNGDPITRCVGRVDIGRERVLGCQATGGDVPWLASLALLWWLTRRRVSRGPFRS